MLTSLLRAELAAACQSLGCELPGSVSISEAPAHANAEYATNVALVLAKSLGRSPRDIAEQIAASLQTSDLVDFVEVAGAGFLNMVLTDAAYTARLHAMAQDVLEPVRLPRELRQNLNVEYVSANPSGPLHIGNARGGPLGEAICRLLEAQGHVVTRDFYVNDIGGQADRFAASVLHFYAAELGEERDFPEDGYRGDYVKELAAAIAADKGRSILDDANPVEAMRQEAIACMVDQIRATTDRIGITFDRWYWQHELHDEGLIERALTLLREHGATLEKDGALWLKSGVRDDDRETVLVKSNGTTTYFLDDLAYHLDKLLLRQADRAIVLLGADHSGHPPRMRAGLQAMGLRAEQYDAVVYQYVQLKVDGQVVGMSKREGTMVTAEQVLNEVPRDVFTYFMISKANETHVDFDLELAKDTSEKNPVYSIQYAHARICSLLEKAGEAGDLPAKYKWFSAEIALLKQLDRFSEVVALAAQEYRVNLVAQYLADLAASYHHFYAQHRVVQAEHGEARAVRLRLSLQTKATLAAGLHLLNIEAPVSLGR